MRASRSGLRTQLYIVLETILFSRQGIPLAMANLVVSINVLYSQLQLNKSAGVQFGSPGADKVVMNIDSLWIGGPFENSVRKRLRRSPH